MRALLELCSYLWVLHWKFSSKGTSLEKRSLFVVLRVNGLALVARNQRNICFFLVCFVKLSYELSFLGMSCWTTEKAECVKIVIFCSRVCICLYI